MKCLAHMLSTGLFAAATLPSALAFTWSHSNIKRATYAASDATLYAYGTNISGLEILYGVSDGLLYVAAETTPSNDVSVTFTIPKLASATTTETQATLVNGTSPGVMCVNVNDSGLSDVSLIKSGTATNGSTTGYALYGKQLVYYDGSSLQSKFWAKQLVTGTDSVWQLFWNSENELDTSLVPVSIKTTAPSTSTSS